MNSKCTLLAAFLLGVIITAPLSETKAQSGPTNEYELVDLEQLWFFPFSRTTPAAINDQDQITGVVHGPGFTRGFVYDNGEMILLDTLGGASSAGGAINQIGHIVGFSKFTTDNFDEHAFLYDGSVMMDLGTFEGSASYFYESRALGINNDGVITGWSEFLDPDNPITGRGTKGFILDGDTWISIPHVGVSSSHPLAFLCQKPPAYGHDINDSRQVAGWGQTILYSSDGSGGPDCFVNHAFLYDYDSDNMIDLGTLESPYLNSYAFRINALGQVTGYSETNDGNRLAFIADENGMSSIGTLGGSRSEGHDINDSGQVTGWAINSEGQLEAFFYDGTRMVGLCSLVDCDSYGWRSLRAGFAINNNGSIAGYGYVFDDLSLHGFLLRIRSDTQGPVTSNVVIDPSVTAVGGEVILTATVDDAQSGNSNVVSADYSLAGATWHPMDGSWGSPTLVAHSLVDVPAAAGVYEVCVRGTDALNNVGEPACVFLVAYDPSGGFVTGGGWIDSPLGACQLSASCATLTGKANFGFVSKYKVGATTPTGNTEFQFKAGNLNFHSISYDWLVIAGAKAMYKGTGTINGAGSYGFMLSVIDAYLRLSTDVDLFRIKIWDKDNGDFVVYDNQMTDAEDALPTTAIGGGSIKIHKAK